MVPVENSTEGVVTHTLDMFVDSDLKIVAQIVLPIQYCLAGNGKPGNVRRLYVHPQALAQCQAFFAQHPHPIGRLPAPGALDLSGLHLADGAIDELLRVDLDRFRYASHRVVLHTDRAFLPRSPAAWAAWLLINFSSGFGWFWVLEKRLSGEDVYLAALAFSVRRPASGVIADS